jgi:cobalamin biosynthesis protein CbiG
LIRKGTAGLWRGVNRIPIIILVVYTAEEEGWYHVIVSLLSWVVGGSAQVNVDGLRLTTRLERTLAHSSVVHMRLIDIVSVHWNCNTQSLHGTFGRIIWLAINPASRFGEVDADAHVDELI